MPLPCTEEQIGMKHLTFRFSQADDGTRPVPTGERTSRSPDIWLDHGGDTTVDAYTANAAPGAVNVIMVRVHNFSDEPLGDINVEAWVCDYTMGFGPSAQIASAGPLPRTGFFAGPLAPGDWRTIVCEPPWDPAPGDKALNGGHVCLAANCWAETPPEGQPLSGELDFRCDAHHAHRNIAVRAISLAVGELILELPVMATNPDPQQEWRFLVTIRPVTAHDLEVAWEDLLEVLQTGPLAGSDVRPSPLEPLEVSLIGDGLEPTAGQEQIIALGPGEQRPLIMRIVLSPNEEIGNVHMFDAIQVRGEEEEIGSARLVAVVTP